MGLNCYSTARHIHTKESYTNVGSQSRKSLQQQLHSLKSSRATVALLQVSGCTLLAHKTYIFYWTDLHVQKISSGILQIDQTLRFVKQLLIKVDCKRYFSFSNVIFHVLLLILISRPGKDKSLHYVSFYYILCMTSLCKSIQWSVKTILTNNNQKFHR